MALRYDKGGPCMCGATDCRSCGPAQGYGPEDDYEEEPDRTEPDDYECDRAADAACDRYERDLDRTASQ